MTRDGRGEGRVSSVDEIIHMVRLPHEVLHLLHGLLHLVHFSLQMWHTLSDNSFGLISSFGVVFRLSIFWVLPIFLNTQLLTSLVNSWFCYIKSAIATAMDYNYCWTDAGCNAGAWFEWLKAFSLFWCFGLVAIDLVQTMHPFVLESKVVNTSKHCLPSHRWCKLMMY